MYKKKNAYSFSSQFSDARARKKKEEEYIYVSIQSEEGEKWDLGFFFSFEKRNSSVLLLQSFSNAKNLSHPDLEMGRGGRFLLCFPYYNVIRMGKQY